MGGTLQSWCRVKGMAPTVGCVLLRKGEKVLGSSRRDNHNDWGLPGGKLDPGEDPRVGAARELFEETGIRVKPEDLVQVFERTDGTNDEWFAVTYEATTWEGEPTQQPGEGLVEWVEWEAIESGSFGHYNQALHRALRAAALGAIDIGPLPDGAQGGGFHAALAQAQFRRGHQGK
jgi:ADP-ribose pyrophosphatase YjhB (NUDIX family)